MNRQICDNMLDNCKRVIIYISSTTIHLSYNAESTLNGEKELSKEKKKMKNIALTCVN